MIRRPILTVGPVARSLNGVIGRDGGLPWTIRSDLKLFRRLTMGKPVIMGRRTWESLPNAPLKGRLNLVLSRDGSFQAKGAVVCETLDEAIQIGREQAEEDGEDEVCVIGGAALFAAALPKARRLYLTEVIAEVQGDVLFPPFAEGEWEEAERLEHPREEGDDHDWVFRRLERR
jgi:dihydrofolate reductase